MTDDRAAPSPPDFPPASPSTAQRITMGSGAPHAVGGGGEVADLCARLAPRLADDGQRRLLRELLERLAVGGGEAVRTDVRQRVRAILGEEP